MAHILHLDGVNLQGASWQELQPGEGEQVNLWVQGWEGWEGDKCPCSHMQHVPTELV